MEIPTTYPYRDGQASHTQAYLWPAVIRGIELKARTGRIFDLGCGNGAFAAALAARGHEVRGVDPSVEGIRIANTDHPDLDLRVGSAYDDLWTTFGRFPKVVSLEVVEHVYDPHTYARTLYNLVDEGGVAILSTPYHGYAKNLALAVAGKMDAHFTALWAHGHIKFWSEKTLSVLLRDAGFRDVAFQRVGRIPAFAKSMIATAYK